MLTFQSKKYRNCVSANATRQKYSGNREYTHSKQLENSHFTTNQQEKQNHFHNNQSCVASISCVDPYREQMRFLIQQNSNYFQSKVRITDKARPNQYRFKIPTKTPQTIYKKNFNPKQKNLSVDNLKLNTNTLSQTIKRKQSHQKLLLATTYQNQFGIKKQNTANSKINSFFNPRKSKQVKHNSDDDVPRFLETQNKCFFLNWGGKNPITSMKPSYQTVAVNFPLECKTTYNNDFQGTIMPPTKTIIPESSMSKFKNPFMINRSCYQQDFSIKENRSGMQKSYKPKNELIKTCSTLKGNTEYRSQFMKNRNSQEGFSFEMGKNEIQTLIMDL